MCREGSLSEQECVIGFYGPRMSENAYLVYKYSVRN